MIPDFKTFIGESIWSDIQDRSSGETIRKEDDINYMNRIEFFEYLKDLYKPARAVNPIREYEDENCILVPLFHKDYGYRPSDNCFISIEYSDEDLTETKIVISKKIEYFAPEILELLKNEFDVELIPKTPDRGEHFTITSKNNHIVSNSFFIEVIDFILNNLNTEEHKKLIEKI